MKILFFRRLYQLAWMSSFFLLPACASLSQPPHSTKNVATHQAYQATGIASWYGSHFHGRRTASGDRYDMNQFTAAHRTLPFGTMVRVTNLDNNQVVLVRINDRGPFSKNRLIDVSRAAARQLDFTNQGTARVQLEWSDHPETSVEVADADDTEEEGEATEHIEEMIRDIEAEDYSK